MVFYAEVVAFTEGLVWFSLFVICDVCFEVDDSIVWSCDQELVVCQLDLWTGQFRWTVRGGEEVESNVTGWDTDSLPGSYSHPLARMGRERRKRSGKGICFGIQRRRAS